MENNLEAAERNRVISFAREMGISHAEFLRTLPRAVADQPYTVEANTIILKSGERHVRIGLAPQRDRVLASIRLPVTVVNFQFSGYSPGDVKQFMERFDLYFHRGGG